MMAKRKRTRWWLRALWAVVSGGLTFVILDQTTALPVTAVAGISGGAAVLGALLGPAALELLALT